MPQPGFNRGFKRNFSTGMPQKDESIFAAADIFKESGDAAKSIADSTQATDTASSLYNIPWIDSTDTLGAFMSAIPKDIANITQGV